MYTLLELKLGRGVVLSVLHIMCRYFCLIALCLRRLCVMNRNNDPELLGIKLESKTQSSNSIFYESRLSTFN